MAPNCAFYLLSTNDLRYLSRDDMKPFYVRTITFFSTHPLSSLIMQLRCLLRCSTSSGQLRPRKGCKAFARSIRSSPYLPTQKEEPFSLTVRKEVAQTEVSVFALVS